MTITDIRDFCSQVYSDTYTQERQNIENDIIARSRFHSVPKSKKDEIETDAQKEAICKALIEGVKHFPDVELTTIWHAVYESHVHRKSGIDDVDIIAKVISADQSWKKSSGHAFEEVIKLLGNIALNDCGISILLQRDLTSLINNQELDNEPRDIDWLKTQTSSDIFDHYAVLQTSENKRFCYGCIQSKTSIRDRVSRDREPSINAMRSFFWSTAIVLDGDFLKLPKFNSMVNGGSTAFPTNGWHGMYVFSGQYLQDRIYSIDLDFKNFKEHAVKAAHDWLNRRQWFDEHWRADNA